MACRWRSTIVEYTIFTLLVPFVSCSTLYFEPHKEGSQGIYPFQNTSLSWHERVDDLVSRLTLEEIQEQMTRGGSKTAGSAAPAIHRLGIGPYMWADECLRGDVLAPGNATAFPQAIGLAATFSADLVHRVATATGVEVRGKHNQYVKQGDYQFHTGATCFSPVVNIVRDPRWGRIQETYGEDPFLSGILAEQFVHGLQGNDSRYIQVGAGCKHFDAHGGPENIPAFRLSFDAEVSETDWRMTFLPAFKKCVDAGSFSLMCSYNRLNGIPACAHNQLLTDILRTEWNFTGYVVSDRGALEFMILFHHYFHDNISAAAAAVNAGCNLELPIGSAAPIFSFIVDAVKQGKTTEAMVRERVKPLFYTRMRLGEFDPPDMNPYSKLDASSVESPEHQSLAVEAAVKSFILLKNQKSILPLKPESYKNVAVVGPMADNVTQLFGDYSPVQDRSFTKTPLQGLKELFSDIRYAPGCTDGTECTVYNKAQILETISGTDLILVAVGTGKNAKVIFLLFNAGPLNVTVLDQSEHVDAIMECFLPAQASGDALVNVLTNKDGKSSPAARLPITWPMFDWQMPNMTNYSMTDRTYRYITYQPLYPFGYGLSYASFAYDLLATLYYPANPGWGLECAILVTNNSTLDADEVIQCYVEWANKSLPVPRRQLVYFNRVHLKAGEEQEVKFNVSAQGYSYWDHGQWHDNPGKIFLYCGGQQPNQEKMIPSNVLDVEIDFNQTMWTANENSAPRGQRVKVTSLDKEQL